MNDEINQRKREAIAVIAAMGVAVAVWLLVMGIGALWMAGF